MVDLNDLLARGNSAPGFYLTGVSVSATVASFSRRAATVTHIWLRRTPSIAFEIGGALTFTFRVEGALIRTFAKDLLRAFSSTPSLTRRSPSLGLKQMIRDLLA